MGVIITPEPVNFFGEPVTARRIYNYIIEQFESETIVKDIALADVYKEIVTEPIAWKDDKDVIAHLDDFAHDLKNHVDRVMKENYTFTEALKVYSEDEEYINEYAELHTLRDYAHMNPEEVIHKATTQYLATRFIDYLEENTPWMDRHEIADMLSDMC